MNEQIHQCPTQPAEIRIERDVNYFGKEENWVLIISRFATEQDLEENSYLQEVGEEIWSTVVEISHCPYCGINLALIQDRKAKMAHFDYTGWNSKRS